jgi:flagellar hook-associated protein 1 FlgK
MSLFGSLQMAGGALQANQLALQVVGQNISNSQTPGYIQEDVNFQAGPTQRQGNVLLGTGVQVQGVIQQINQFLQARMRGAASDQSSAQTVLGGYQQLETLTNSLSSSDMDSQLTSFFSSISNVLNQPNSPSTLALAVGQGQTLVSNIQQLANGVTQLHSDLDTQVGDMAGSINTLLQQIGQLNGQIANVQGSVPGELPAVGLVDQQQEALQNLSQLININTQNNPDGSVTVTNGQNTLVIGTDAQQVQAVSDTNQGLPVTDLEIQGSGAKLDTSSGQLGGLVNARDNVAGTFLNQLNAFTNTFSSAFNQIYSSGQGLVGFTSVTAQSAVSSPDVPLNAAGLLNTPVNGSFQIIVNNTATGATTTNTIQVQLEGKDTDTTLQDLANQINQNVSGVTATISPQGTLSLQSNISNTQFAFANDTSGALSALGINTFFTGSTAATLGVNADVVANPSLFAASQGGIGNDTDNATALANLQNTPLASAGGNTLSTLYDGIVSQMAQGAAQAQNTSDAATSYQQTIVGQQASVSGVNVDDEAVKMLQYQAAYQATAKYVTTLDTLMNTLFNM